MVTSTTTTGPVVLAGATGYIGRAVAKELVSRDYEVVALVRDPEARIPGCETQVVDVTDAAGLQTYRPG